MRRSRQPNEQKCIKHGLYVCLLLSSLLGLTVAGCQPNTNPPTTQPSLTPTQVLAAANQSLAISITTLNDLRSAGYISNGDWANIQTAITAASNALDAWQANLNNSGAAQAQAAFDAALPQILQLIHDTEAKKTATTHPVGG